MALPAERMISSSRVHEGQGASGGRACLAQPSAAPVLRSGFFFENLSTPSAPPR